MPATMPRVEIAKNAGACYGVERALGIVEEQLGGELPVYTLGPLIHNPIVVGELEDRGVQAQGDVSLIDAPATVIIRSHGVASAVVDMALKRELNVVDATCPHVKRAQEAAASLAEKGYQVLVVGEPGHPEVEGILSRAGTNAHVVDCLDCLKTIKLNKKVGVVVQTTQTETMLQEIVGAVSTRVRELRIFNTICAATTQRQTAAAELAKVAGCMVVIGGRNSGNTRRLAQVCSLSCTNTHHIESPDEIDPSWFEGVELVGVTAGASTPAGHVQDVRSRIEGLICL